MPASFPTSIKSFASRSAGQTIGSAHMNDVQDEIAAIETTLITGPITLPASTLASLSVTGGSTLASLTVAGAMVFSVPRVRLTHSVDSNMASGGFVGLNWDTETYDPSGMHSTSVNSSRITFADSTGVYRIGATVEFNPAAVGGVAMRILLNDSTANVVVANGAGNTGSLNHPLSVAGEARISSTSDYATVQVVQNSGSTRSVTSTGFYTTAFWASKVSA